MPLTPPTERELLSIYVAKGYDTFCEFGGLIGEGRDLALGIWRMENEAPPEGDE